MLPENVTHACIRVPASLFGESVLILAFRNASGCFEVSEEIFEADAGALIRTVRLEHEEALRARASSKVVIHGCGIDAVLLVAFDR